MGILLGSLLAIFIVALVELIPVFLGYIPYAGPVIVALLSVPLFIINFAVMIDGRADLDRCCRPWPPRAPP